MSRFFKTARSQFVDDSLFELPTDLAKQVLQQQDNIITQDNAKLDDFQKQLQIQNLKIDDPIINEKIGAHREKIINYTQDLLKNPLDNRKRRMDLAKFSQELQHDLNKGVLGKGKEQLEALNKFNADLDSKKNVDSDRKDLIKAVVQKRYQDKGGLNFQDENNYNAISDGFIEAFEEYDEEKFIKETGTNFVADTTAKAFASNTPNGYIRSGARTVEIRSEQDIEDYVSSALSEGTWENQKRQRFELERELGRTTPEDFGPNGELLTIDQKVEISKQNLIDRAKNRLGYRKETKKAGLSGDPVFAQAQRDLHKPGGLVTGTRVDMREGIKNRDFSPKYNHTDIESFKEIGKKISVLEEGSPEDMYNRYWKNGSLSDRKALKQKLAPLGVDFTDFTNYMNYNLDVQDRYVVHDENDPKNMAKNISRRVAVVEEIKNYDPNEEVRKIVVRSGEESQELHYNKIKDLTQNNAEDQYLYIPVEKGQNANTFNKNLAGALVNSTGNAIIDPTSGEPVTNYKQALEAGLENQLTLSNPNFNTNKILWDVNPGNTTQYQERKVSPKGGKKDEKVYVVSNSYYRKNKQSGEIEHITIDVEYDSNKILIKE